MWILTLLELENLFGEKRFPFDGSEQQSSPSSIRLQCPFRDVQPLAVRMSEWLFAWWYDCMHSWLYHVMSGCSSGCMGALLFVMMFCRTCAGKQSWFYSAMQPLLFVRIHAAKKGCDSPWFAPMDTYVTLRHRISSPITPINQFVTDTFAVWECTHFAYAAIRRCIGSMITFRRNACGNFVNKHSRRVVFRAARNFSGHPKPRHSRPERRHLPPKSEPPGRSMPAENIRSNEYDGTEEMQTQYGRPQAEARPGHTSLRYKT